MDEIKSHGSKRKEEFMMDRYTVTMRHKLLGFLQYSLNEELCFALLCPDQTDGKDLRTRIRQTY